MDLFKSIQPQMFSSIILLILLIFQMEIKCQNNTEQAASNVNVKTEKISIEGNVTDFKLPGLNKFNKVRLNEKNYERVRNMHANWYGAGIKALMGKMGRHLYLKLSIDEQRKLANCLDVIEDKKDLVLGANCLINARKGYEKKRRILDEQKVKKMNGKNRGNRNKNEINDIKENIEQNGLKRIKLRKLGNKRMTHSEENIRDNERRKRMIGKGMELIEWLKRLRKFRGKYKFDQKNSRKKELEENSKMQKSKWAIIEREGMKPKFEIRQADELEKLPSQEDRSAIIRISNLISMFGANKNCTEERMSGAKWTKIYESLVRLKKANEKRKESPGARVYEMRMYDLVLGRKEPSLGPKQKMSPEGLIQMGISLLNKLHNGTDQRESNFKFMSPRFAPLMPDKQDAHKSILSPTIFALYEPEMNQENEPKLPFNIASIPEVLKATGLNKQDRDALLESLMEVSGSIGHIQEAMELLKSLNFFEIEPDLMDANERILNAYTKMERTFDLEQENEIEREGWTFLRGRQFDQLCQEQNAELPEKMRREIEEFGKLEKEKREMALWKRIERIARNIPDEIGDKLDARKHEKMIRLHLDKKLRRRRKRQTNPQQIQWLSVLRPVILQPFMFTPVYGLTVLGPLILSPNIFSPIILSPSVFSPFILSPGAPIPYILSPYVLSPFILSPMALAPFILNPYVLSPNLLNPFALAPLILSPSVLSPEILSPQILGGGILSPTVGSPAVLTESYLMASVLSPSVLSK